jgi:polysaccharide pyruvyl transferase WcaK-like protein
MKVLLIDDSSSNPNWGDRAAAFSLKHMILKSGANSITNITETELVHSTFHNKSCEAKYNNSYSRVKETVKMFIPPIVMKVKDKVTSNAPMSIDDDIIPKRLEDFEKHSRHIFNNRNLYSNLLDTIASSDVIVVHGCELHRNGRDYRSYLFLIYIAKIHFAKPVIIVNLTVDFLDPEIRQIAEHILPLLDDVVCRDSVSAERSKELCNGRFAPDTAFIFKAASPDEWLPVSRRLTYFDVFPDTCQFDPGAPYICVGGSSIFVYNSQYNPIEGYLQLVEHLMSIYTGQVILTACCGIDERLFKPIAAYLKLPLIAFRTPVQQAVDILGNAQAYVGGRWHGGIFAMTGGSPIIPLSAKTFKMLVLAQMAGLPAHMFDALNLAGQKDAIGKQLLCCLEQGDELRSRLRQWAEDQSEKCWDNVTYLKNFSERMYCR